MRLITRQVRAKEYIAEAASNADVNYFVLPGRFAKLGDKFPAAFEELMALGDSPDPNEVERIMLPLYRKWAPGHLCTRSMCSECKEVVDTVMELGTDTDFEDNEIKMQFCYRCLYHAHNTIDEALSEKAEVK